MLKAFNNDIRFAMILNYFELIKDQIAEEFKSIKVNELILVLMT